MRHQNRDLSLGAITAVTTSRIGRKLGFAQNVTARQLATSAEDGASVAALGMFEQGFYNQLGFGTGSYEHFVTFDPGTLKTTAPYRTPSRLTKDDWVDVHDALTTRKRMHGGVMLDPPMIVEAELGWTENGGGLGYYTDGKLTHFIWFGTKEVERGPYRITMMAYRDTDELAELLTLIRSLGDQVYSITMSEPPEIQLQAFLNMPFRNRSRTKRSKHENGHESEAWWQVRVLDVAQALDGYVARRPVRFNLSLTDPVQDYLDPGSAWRGIGGDYIVSLDDNSSATSGNDPDLPTLRADVGAYSRLFFGVAPATSLVLTDDMQAPEDLLVDLDAAFLLPRPAVGLDF
jgi:predicted acetyltransferase